MTDAFEERRKILALTVLFGLACALAAFFLKKNDWAFGVAGGTLAGAFNYYFLFRHLAVLRERTLRPADHVARFFLRYLFLGLLFFLAFRIPGIHFGGFLLGFFLVYLSSGLFVLRKIFRK
ncbi:MAG TPA: ATP synthase subunit I [Candidatus Omnitrophota bacterium]|nr:ATP synthase subunit I [Candidatus Omnitrophota bacterium]